MWLQRGRAQRGCHAYNGRPVCRADPIARPPQTQPLRYEMKAIVVLLLACGMVGVANAAPASPAKCQPGTPAGELACLRPDLKELGEAIDRQLYQLSRKLRKSERTKGTAANSQMKKSQRDWLRYRDSYCALESLVSANNADRWLQVRHAECEMRMSKDRLESLRDVEATLE